LFGVADVSIEGLKGPIPCPVIFAPEASLFLLGATALGNFGVDADPVTKTLKPVLSPVAHAAPTRGAAIGGHTAAEISDVNGTPPESA
jgi:hypothetical protein